MKYADRMDFSTESNFREKLLGRIKAECFGELEDDELAWVNAAGDLTQLYAETNKPDPWN